MLVSPENSELYNQLKAQIYKELKGDFTIQKSKILNLLIFSLLDMLETSIAQYKSAKDKLSRENQKLQEQQFAKMQAENAAKLKEIEQLQTDFNYIDEVLHEIRIEMNDANAATVK
mgnify:CR=1 FL=1